jgi:protein TonB
MPAAHPAHTTLPPPAHAGGFGALRAAPALTRGQVRRLVVAVACAHLAGVWALLQVPALRDAVRQVAPMVVDLVSAEAPQATPPPRAALPAPPQPVLQPPQAPLLAAPVLQADPAPAFTAAPAPAEPLPQAPVTATQAPVAPAPAAPAAAPLARKVVPPTAVQYLVLPPVEVPRASRRAGEHGVVWLRVVVDVRGLPAQIHLQRSSGHPRLDEQALWAMRQARFKPQTDNGTQIELEVTAPIDYPLD